jgi:hypothetical protein
VSGGSERPFGNNQRITRLESAGPEPAVIAAGQVDGRVPPGRKRISCKEIAVGADQDFDAFLREWAEEFIWPVEDFLDNRDQTYLAERRSIELVQLAQRKGFSNELAAKVKSYGSVLQYVTNLFWRANFNARSN